MLIYVFLLQISFSLSIFAGASRKEEISTAHFFYYFVFVAQNRNFKSGYKNCPILHFCSALITIFQAAEQSKS